MLEKRSNREETATTFTIPVDQGEILADLYRPENFSALVLFVHGSGSNRQSPRNLFVARELTRNGFATLLLDLLTEKEAEEDQRTAAYRFHISLLTRRVVHGIDWIRKNAEFAHLPLGCYGASTGAAAALCAAAERVDDVAAVVSRGGRVDLAEDVLHRVLCPVLLIVGERDPIVLQINRLCFPKIGATIKQLVVIPGASHLFQEPGALEAVARHTVEWFQKTLQGKGENGSSYSF